MHLRGLWLGLGLVGVLGCVPLRNSSVVQQQEREIIALRLRQQQLQQQLAQCPQVDPALDPLHPLYTQLLQIFADSEVSVTRRQGDVFLTIPMDLLFSSGEVQLRAESAMVLDLLGLAFQQHPQTHTQVTGYLDDQPLSAALRGQYADAWMLSAAFAAAFVRQLTTRYGAQPAQFTIAGRAALDPIADNATPEGRARNRRLTLLISPRP